MQNITVYDKANAVCVDVPARSFANPILISTNVYIPEHHYKGYYCAERCIICAWYVLILTHAQLKKQTLTSLPYYRWYQANYGFELRGLYHTGFMKISLHISGRQWYQLWTLSVIWSSSVALFWDSGHGSGDDLSWIIPMGRLWSWPEV